MIHQKLSFPLPLPWINTVYECETVGPINYLVGPNGSGKSRFAETLKSHLNGSRLLGTDRLRGMNKNEGMGFIGEHFDSGIRKNQFNHLKEAGSNFGFGLDTFVILEERPDIRISIEATLSSLFDREVILEWDSGNLLPKAILRSRGTTYRLDRDECHGIKELLVLLTHLYNDQHPYLIIDEPELNLHPQYQAFFLQEARKLAGLHSSGTRKKILFLITHSPFIIDIKNIDDLSSIISFDLKHTKPKRLGDSKELDLNRIQSLIPRVNIHHNC